MSNAETVQRYFDSWNRHDASGLVATFAAGGTYQDPTTEGPLAGDAIGENAAALWSAFPDVTFELKSHVDDGNGLLAAQWVMRGTNTGSFRGLPPTGRSVVVPGADFIRVDDEGIRSVEGYFNAGEVPRQLGMQIVVQPNQIGPFTFGVASRVSADRVGAPGAFSITSLHAASDEDVENVRNVSREIAMQMRELEGFMGLVTATIGDRMLTITAWEGKEHPLQTMRVPAHQKAARGFFGNDYAAGGWVSVWTPEHQGSVWSRCRQCGRMTDTGAESGRCECGASLPDPRPHW